MKEDLQTLRLFYDAVLNKKVAILLKKCSQVTSFEWVVLYYGCGWELVSYLSPFEEALVL